MQGRCRGKLRTRLLGAPSFAAIALIIGVTVRRVIAALMLAAPAGEDDRKVARKIASPHSARGRFLLTPLPARNDGALGPFEKGSLRRDDGN